MAYDNYSLLWKQQGAGIDKLPLHFKGEVLAGLTQSAQRTGHGASRAVPRQDADGAGDTHTRRRPSSGSRIPASAATTSLTCKNCHNAGRLENRVAALKQ